MLQFNFAPFPNLITSRLLLRQLTLQDDKEIFLLRSDERVNEFIDRAKATTINDALNFINKINSFILNNESLYWALTLKPGNKLIGTFALFNFSKEKGIAEIGYELLPFYHGKGIMQEAFIKVIEYGFEILKLNEIQAWLHPGNLKSLNLLKRNGFKRDLLSEKVNKEELKDQVIYILNNKQK